MGIHHSRLPELFRRYYHNLASADEIEELKAIIREAKSDGELLHLVDNAWNELNDVENIIDSESSSKMLATILESGREEEKVEDRDLKKSDANSEKGRALWFRYIAAAMVIAGGIGLFWGVWKSGNKQAASTQVAVVNEIAPAGNRATLTLSDGSRIALDQAKEGVLAIQGKTEINKSKDGAIVYRADKEGDPAAGHRLNTISTPRGGTFEIVLPDGSKAWLNTSSAVTFPATFKKNERHVSIQGEVFFEVTRDPVRPFTVSFAAGEVKVLGTSFNVRDYADEELSRATLVEGSVTLTSGNGSSRLIPGEQGSIDKGGNIKKTVANVEEAIAWKNGVFYFEDAGIQTVMKEVSRWYDIDVDFEGEPIIRRFSGKVSREASISEFMNIMNYIGVKYRIEGRKVVITK
jgi:transmembrane sensor